MMLLTKSAVILLKTVEKSYRWQFKKSLSLIWFSKLIDIKQMNKKNITCKNKENFAYNKHWQKWNISPAGWQSLLLQEMFNFLTFWFNFVHSVFFHVSEWHILYETLFNQELFVNYFIIWIQHTSTLTECWMSFIIIFNYYCVISKHLRCICLNKSYTVNN